MLVLFAQRGLVTSHELQELLPELDELCRMITAFARTVTSRSEAKKTSLRLRPKL